MSVLEYNTELCSWHFWYLKFMGGLEYMHVLDIDVPEYLVYPVLFC